MNTLTHQELRELALSKRRVGILTIDFRHGPAASEAQHSAEGEIVCAG
jgi:hypothetical protein